MKNKYEINNTVKVNDGMHTEDFNIDLSGRIGTITDVILNEGETPLYQVYWDSKTLNSLELSSIKYLEKQTYDWEFSLLYENEIVKVEQRCTETETEKTLEAINNKLEVS